MMIIIMKMNSKYLKERLVSGDSQAVEEGAVTGCLRCIEMQYQRPNTVLASSLD